MLNKPHRSEKFIFELNSFVSMMKNCSTKRSESFCNHTVEGKESKENNNADKSVRSKQIDEKTCVHVTKHNNGEFFLFFMMEPYIKCNSFTNNDDECEWSNNTQVNPLKRFNQTELH